MHDNVVTAQDPSDVLARYEKGEIAPGVAQSELLRMIAKSKTATELNAAEKAFNRMAVIQRDIAQRKCLRY